MPDTPANPILILSKAQHGDTTERMATSEELLALQLLEEESPAPGTAATPDGAPAARIATGANPGSSVIHITFPNCKPEARA